MHSELATPWITITILPDDLDALLDAYKEVRDVCGSPEPCEAPDCKRMARLTAARDAAVRRHERSSR